MSTATLSRPKARRTWTYDEFAAESLETNLPTELWDGEIIMSAAPRPAHQRIASRTWRLLDEFVVARKFD